MTQAQLQPRSQSQTRGVVLFSHGSRDPLWRAPMDAVALRMKELNPQALVSCAFLELMTPDLKDCVAGLVDAGATAIDVVPMFLGMGRHAREDLPELLRALETDFPQVAFTQLTAIGEDARVVELLAQLALQEK